MEVDEIKKLIEAGISDSLSSDKYSLKTMLISMCICFIVGGSCGFYIGHTWFTKVVKGDVINVPTPYVVKEKADVKTEIQMVYVPKNEVSLDSPLAGKIVGKNSTIDNPTVLEKTNMQMDISFPEFNVLVNGKMITFNKEEYEKYVTERNKLLYTQSTKISFDITAPPIPLEKPRPEVGLYGTTKSVGLIFSQQHPKSDGSTILTITTPWREKDAEKVEIGIGITKKL